MVTVEKVSGGPVYIRPLDRDFEIGDRADVDEEWASYLIEERGDFERLVDVEAAGEPDADEEGDTETEYEERVALAEGLANEHWRAAANAVEDGDADEYLDELAKRDDRESVQNAIEERRAELED